MTVGTVTHNSPIGPTTLDYRECDQCSKRRPDDGYALGWLRVERDAWLTGEWDRRDFCGIEHLAAYFAPHGRTP